MKNRRLSLPLIFLLFLLACPSGALAQEQKKPIAGLASIRQYISAGWDNLTRSMTDCASVVDPKMKVNPVIYLPAGFAAPPAVEKLHAACNVDIEHLPKPIHQLGEIDTNAIHPHGLLYLENRYVVPGGRFNEMYGWDSYFIILGLLRDGRHDLARGMVENFFFEIENYGALLNANRTYYLTRSQPPFLTSMVLAVYDAEKQAGHADPAWLARAYSYLEKDYSMWTRDPHLAGATGLARYYDFGDGSATHHYAPVCLNSLLYKTETDMDQISGWIGKVSEAKAWRERAEKRKSRMQQYLWDGDRGFFFDYDFTGGKKSSYRYLTTYYPLWAGLASPEQAAAVVKNLSVFEQPGGLAMSPENSGAQWDYPYGWAPVELLAIQGLRRYGYNTEADRLSYKFLSTVIENFQRDGTIREKYNVVPRSSESQVAAGYQTNVIGFGWTNAAFLELLHALPKEAVEKLEKEASVAKSAQK